MARILLIQPDPSCPPALFGGWLQEAGCRLDVRHPYRGDEQPTIGPYDGLLVLGGPMDADDDAGHPWLVRTRELIREAAGRGVPTLGICLGHQLAALALGGMVGRSTHGPRIGVLPVGWECDVLLDPLLGRIAGDGRAVQWNQDVVLALPPDAVALALTPAGEIQAARLAATVWGVQFHPEADEAIVADWADADGRDGGGLLPVVGLTPGEVVAQASRAATELVDAWRPLAASFARMVRGRAAAHGDM